jgi:hypothetical protein
MFPRDFFIDYWRPALRDEVFVAMPFASEFASVWEKAISPAVERCGLKPYRVDMRKACDSILIDILDGVAHARLILVDLSTVSCRPTSLLPAFSTNALENPQFANGNVMYELGLAHATRQAEEVILVRNQTDSRLLFDVSGVRVHSYPPSNLEFASEIFENLIREALGSIDRTKSLQVGKALQAITVDEIRLIRRWWPYSFMIYPEEPDGDMKHQVPSSISVAASELQKLGMLHVTPPGPGSKFSINLSWTEFGNAVVKALGPGIIQGRPDPRTASCATNKQKMPEARNK